MTHQLDLLKKLKYFFETDATFPTEDDKRVNDEWVGKITAAIAEAEAAPCMLEALNSGCDALEHALMQLPKDANQRLGMEGALKRMANSISKAEGKA